MGQRRQQCYTLHTVAILWSKQVRIRVTRGLRLACEQCDFDATMSERIAFAIDEQGMEIPLVDASSTLAAGYWSDALCGTCLVPIRTTFFLDTDAPGNVTPSTCPHCGSPLLTFDEAAHALAEAAHSRAWVDMNEESALIEAIQVALGEMPALRAEVSAYEITTGEALAKASSHFTFEGDQATLARTETVQEYVHIQTRVENARDLPEVERVLRHELELAETRLSGLRICVDDEALLPGVPCPKCQTGQLIHWPVWS